MPFNLTPQDEYERNELADRITILRDRVREATERKDAAAIAYLSGELDREYYLASRFLDGVKRRHALPPQGGVDILDALADLRPVPGPRKDAPDAAS
jgi:hypothetical protein